MPQHVFISYSRRDTDFVTRLRADLAGASIDVWLDTEDLVPGAPNWEQAIRDAINNAAAVILVASEDSRQSVYVQGELTLAKIRQRPVYPVWARGEAWIDCVPLDMVNYQYIDCRAHSYDQGQQTLIDTLHDLVDVSEGVITLGLPTHETIELNLALFNNAFDILNHVYLNYLQDWYPPNSYGSEWILGNVHTKQLAVPWDWLLLDPNDYEALLGMYVKHSQISYQDFGIADKSYWAVWESQRLHSAGVVTNNDELAQRLLSKYSSRDLWLLHSQQRLTVTAPQEINQDAFRHQFVLAIFGTTFNRVAFIENDASSTIGVHGH